MIDTYLIGNLRNQPRMQIGYVKIGKYLFKIYRKKLRVTYDNRLADVVKIITPIISHTVYPRVKF